VAAAETVQAASAHIKTLIARNRLVNGQLREAHRQLDALIEELEHHRAQWVSMIRMTNRNFSQDIT
jgi:hypothetical protein